MKRRLQFAGWLMAPLLAAGLVLPGAAQQPHKNDRPPQQRQEQRRERREERQAQRQQQRPPQSERPPSVPNEAGHRGGPPVSPPQAGEIRSERPQGNQSIPRGAAPEWQGRLRDMPPQERERFLQNNERFGNLPADRQAQIRQHFQKWDRLSPEQREHVRDNERVWRQMTAEQRNHIRSEVLPTWNQLPAGRKQAIQQRLRVLKEMPESARNQRLNDPNFTRGMSGEDKSLLRDLSHLHVGGALEPPSE